MFPSSQVQFTDPHPNPSGKMYHILRVHRVQSISKILIQILILNKTLHFRKASCPNISETRQIIFQEQKELGNLISKGNLIHKYLPKQTNIDKILEAIQRKVLKGNSFASQNQRDTGRVFT